jgi:Protein of unknown function (DUF3037)
MSSAKGYYSIIQYCPDPSRLEAVNIGVALFSPDTGFLRAKFGRRHTRITQLFGKQDREFIQLQQTAVEARLAAEQGTFHTLEDFERYVSRRANALVMTNPRPVKVENPEQELERLLRRLVSAQREHALGPAGVTRQLGRIFEQAEVVSRLRREVTVRPPALPKPFRAPFAYQNGRLNLIEPVQFEGHSPEKIFNKASILAVEGEFLSDYSDPQYGNLSLVVVAKFAPERDQDKKTAAAVFEKHSVPMYTFEALGPLIEDIRRQAH